MCGIAGIVGPAEPHQLAALGAGIAHRGPDGAGFRSFGGSALVPGPVAAGRCHLVHTRLAILDLRPAADQPMATPDGRHWLIFNGEIYNHRELRRQLETDGERFATTSDTEVLLRLLARHGRAALSHLTGMFAFAWLDTRAGTLLLARDQLGIKPLYVARSGTRWGFASETTPLLALPWVSRAVDPVGINDYLVHGLTDHRDGTCWRDIQQVPAGTWLEIPLAEPTVPRHGRYWTLPGRTADTAQRAAPDALRQLLEDSVARHLDADVPVGITLSGGIDSSAILLCARKAAGAHVPVHAVSYCAADPAIAEERWVRLAAAAADARVHRLEITPGELRGDLDDLIRTQGEPFGSSSIYAQYRVMGRARAAGLTVMLGGQGADELFAGYRSAQTVRIVSAWAAGDPHTAWHLTRTLPPGIWRSVLGLALRRSGVHSPSWGLPRWIGAGWETGPTGNQPVDGHLSHPDLATHLRSGLLHLSLPMLLRYEDRNAMRWGVENRVPFVHLPVVTWAQALQDADLVAADGTSKDILRRAFRGIVPDAILDRSDKIGFATPEKAWLDALAEWAHDLLKQHGSSLPGIDLDRFIAAWEEVRSGRRRFDGRYWRTLNLLRWCDLFNARW